jgi:Zn-dependent peptidase ImmA (M78 family)
MFDYRIVLLDLPCKIKGTTTKDENDFYTIYINARLSDEQQIETFLHELEHIKNDDYYGTCADQLERRCRERMVEYG